jgi:hypothetical protein
LLPVRSNKFVERFEGDEGPRSEPDDIEPAKNVAVELGPSDIEHVVAFYNQRGTCERYIKVFADILSLVARLWAPPAPA